MEPSALAYAERHDNVEAIYKKLEERRDTADVIEVRKERHRIVNEALRAQVPGEDHAEGLTVDLSRIDFAKLRDEFAHKVKRKHAALQDIRDVIEWKLAEMLARNPMRMDYYKKYQEIFILDTLWGSLPRPPFFERDTEALAAQVYDYVWERSASGGFSVAA